MRQPRFSRSRRHSRGYRLARTGIGVAVVVVIVALIANLFGGDGGEEEIGLAQVSFRVAGAASSDGKPATRGAVREESDEIADVLNDWFQKAFVDPKGFAEGDFGDVSELFTEDARPEFTKQLSTLTIGEARTEVERVEPEEAVARAGIFFEKGKDAKFATVGVTFEAEATLKEEAAPPLQIRLTGRFHLTKDGGDWRVDFWDGVKQTQRSVVSSPSPAP